MDELEKELKEDFLEEATDLMEEFEQVFLDLEQDSSPEVLDKIFRFAHNLKGTSRAVVFGQVAEFTHELENLILKPLETTEKLKITDETMPPKWNQYFPTKKPPLPAPPK